MLVNRAPNPPSVNAIVSNTRQCWKPWFMVNGRSLSSCLHLLGLCLHGTAEENQHNMDIPARLAPEVELMADIRIPQLSDVALAVQPRPLVYRLLYSSPTPAIADTHSDWTASWAQLQVQREA